MWCPKLRGNFYWGVIFKNAFDLCPDLNEISNSDSSEKENLENEDGSDDWMKELSIENQNKLQNTINKFVETTDDVFGNTKTIVFSIDTLAHQGIQQRKHRYSPYQMEAINREIDRLLKLNIIEACSFSSWSNPIVAVQKSDKTMRLCLDARQLNKLTIPDAMTIPDVNQILETMPRSKFFSIIDLSMAFHQIPLDEKSRNKTAFFIHNRGFFRYKRMPFGVRNASSCLARLLLKIMPHDVKEIKIYLDDILIATETLEQHLELLSLVANILKQHNLTINKEKSKFCKKKLKFIGFVWDEFG